MAHSPQPDRSLPASTPPRTVHAVGTPARDGRFTVVDTWADCVNLPIDHPEKPLEFFHRQMNEEMNVLENAASSLAEFPDAPWAIRMALARQCSDEARHVQSYKKLLEARGGRVGQYPVMNFQFRILSQIQHLEGRLAVQNRTFEADGLDAAVFGSAEALRQGDHHLVSVYEMQQADEIFHVRFANDYVRERTAQEPVSVLRIARALTQAAEQFRAVFQGGGLIEIRHGVDAVARREAGFAPAEVAVALQTAEARRKPAGAG